MKKRNGIAQAAHFRNSAGSMKHRNEPRGGRHTEDERIISEQLESCSYPSNPHCCDICRAHWRDRFYNSGKVR